MLASIALRCAQFGFLLSLAMTSYADTKITHAQGETKVATPPAKVLTFDLATLDTLDALDVPVTGLPQAIMPERLQKYTTDDYVNIGSLFEPDFEQIASLQADLIVVANRSSKAYKDLSALAPTVDFTISTQDFMDSFKSVSRDIGVIFHKTEQVEAHLARIDEKVANAQNLAKSAGKSLIIMTNGGKLSAYGEDSRFGWIHTELGFQPAVKDFKKGAHGDPISFEYLLNVDPDVLFVVDRDAAVNASKGAARATLDNDLVKRTKAFKNNRIVYLDSSNWYIVMAGLNTVELMVDEISHGVSR